MFIEIIDTADTYRALSQVGFWGEAIFRPYLISTHLRIRIVNVIFQYGGERRGAYILYQIKEVTKERALKQRIFRQILRSGTVVRAFTAPGDTGLGTDQTFRTESGLS